MAVDEPGRVKWLEGQAEVHARWHSEAGLPAPTRVLAVDDTLSADRAYRLASEGTALVWRGDYPNARQLLSAMARRADRRTAKAGQTPAETFNLYRMAQAQRARTLGRLLLPFEAGHRLPLGRAPDVSEACTEAWGEAPEPYVASLRELLGAIGAHEWRRKGVEVPALGGRIHPHYGVFSPVRGEYIELVLKAPLPKALIKSSTAFDIGVGTGVLSVVLAIREIQNIIATDQNDRAIACAKDNIERLHLSNQVTIQKTDLFPDGKAALIVCNPPWLPARPSSSLEHAVYDPGSQMLKGFLCGLEEHLLPEGEGWLILSDLAEHLGLRTREELLNWIDDAGLTVIDRLDTKPHHPKAFDQADALYAARSKEITSLWRLATK